mgnify:FL=1
MKVYLDNAATTSLSDSMKEYLISVLDLWGNPSSLHSEGTRPSQIISDARQAVAKHIHANPNDIYFVPSGSAGNTLAVKGLTSDDPQKNAYDVFYSPTAHKSMLKACESCICHVPLAVDSTGETDLLSLDAVLSKHVGRKPLVCIEAGNSETGTINDVLGAGYIVHKYNGLLAVDVTGYIPSYPVNMELWQNYVDIVTFSGHKLHALKGIGVLWKRENIELKPLVYGSQQNGIAAGTENVIGIASLGKALQDYDYASISPANRDYVCHDIIKNIPGSYLVGPPIESGNRLPHNLFLCFPGVEGESLMFLLDMNGIQASTGSACTGRDITASAALSAIGMSARDIRSCIRLTFNGQETREELDYVCKTLKQCVCDLHRLNDAESGSR